ncbi:MAG: DNRLRE domain-containing protein [Desulfobacterales bacterium]|nr:DNRLRE domain-containing protein [Desulfobacterales bacterium]
MRRLLIVAVVGLIFLVNSAPASATILEFRQGIDLWLSSSGKMDMGNVNLGWGRNLGFNARDYDSLIKFTDMFGDDSSRIPLGSTIASATLHMWIGYEEGRTSYIYQMTGDWTALSTWYTIGSSGGIIPGVNAEADPELLWTGTSNEWSKRSLDLTQSVQGWSNGEDQYGWGFTREKYSTVSAMSLDSSASYRPYLVVDFAPPVAVPEPSIGLLLGCSLAGFVGLRRKFRKN